MYNDLLTSSTSPKSSITKQWYQNSDYDKFLQEIEESVSIAKQAGLVTLIHHPHYGHTDSETQQMFNAWAMCKETSRGLERLVNEAYGHDRILHRRKTINAALYAQDNLRKNNRNDARAIMQTVSSTLSALNLSEWAARSFGGVVFAVQSFRGVVNCCWIIWRSCFCGSIIWRRGNKEAVAQVV
jgi:hypothetical protein